jgi:hypothetical protein
LYQSNLRSILSPHLFGGDIKNEGDDNTDAAKFFSYFDPPVDAGSINLIVR